MNLKELIIQLNDALIDASLTEIETVYDELSELVGAYSLLRVRSI